MGTIVGLDRQKRAPALDAKADASGQGAPNQADGSGRILMFTGVRYQRHSDGRPARPGFDDAAAKAVAKSAKNG